MENYQPINYRCQLKPMPIGEKNIDIGIVCGRLFSFKPKCSKLFIAVTSIFKMV